MRSKRQPSRHRASTNRSSSAARSRTSAPPTSAQTSVARRRSSWSVGLGDRGDEPMANLGLERADHLALVLEGLRVAEIQVDLGDADVGGRGPGTRGWAGRAATTAERLTPVRAAAALLQSVFWTWRVSNASSTSPTLTSWKPSSTTPHSRPASTSRTSSLKRRSEPMRPVQATVPSRTRRTSAPLREAALGDAARRRSCRPSKP